VIPVKSEATPRPWKVYDNERGVGITSIAADMLDSDGDGQDVAVLYDRDTCDLNSAWPRAQYLANAALIVECVNSHSALLAQISELQAEKAILQDAYDCARISESMYRDQIDALAKALRRYGRHRTDDNGNLCELAMHSECPCTCGLDAALAGVTKEAK
jgi:hypothetical protein